MRPGLLVVAPTTVDVVRNAGGWLFDRAMAGWDVTVATSDGGHPRPLTILGARAANLESALTSAVPTPQPRALAVHAELRARDERVRKLVRDALEAGEVEVWLWGDGGSAAAGGGGGPVRHRLSVAARAFKARALAAAAAPGPGDATELFVRGERSRPSWSA